jgi:hypothetical protein
VFARGDHQALSEATASDQMASLEGESNSEYGLRLFKDTCVFGPDDVLPPLSATHGEVREWLKARLPRLLETFKQDVLAAGLVWEEVES